MKGDFSMSIILNNHERLRKICEEVLEKTQKMHDTLKHDYIVKSDDGCINAYDYFLGSFESIVNIIDIQLKKYGKVGVVTDTIFNIIYREYRVKLILKIEYDDNQKISPAVIYTDKENGDRLFIINRETKTVSKPSAATYVDTPFDLMVTIVLNGLRAILESLDYVTDSEILKYAHDHVQEEGRDCDIMLRLIDIIKERESNYEL